MKVWNIHVHTLGINAGTTNSTRHFHRLAIRNNRNILIAMCLWIIVTVESYIDIINIHYQNLHQPLIYTMLSRQTRTAWISICSSLSFWPSISWRSCVCVCVCMFGKVYLPLCCCTSILGTITHCQQYSNTRLLEAYDNNTESFTPLVIIYTFWSWYST